MCLAVRAVLPRDRDHRGEVRDDGRLDQAEWNAVEIIGDWTGASERGGACRHSPNRELRAASLQPRVLRAGDCDAGYAAEGVKQADGTRIIEYVALHHADCDGHILQAFLTLLRGDHDLLEGRVPVLSLANPSPRRGKHRRSRGQRERAQGARGPCVAFHKSSFPVGRFSRLNGII